MKTRLILLGLIISMLTFSCGSKKKKLAEKYGVEEKEKKESKHEPTLAEIFSESITVRDLDRHTTNLASDSMQGRLTGTAGARKAANYIRNFFLHNQLLFPMKLAGYKQKYTASKNSMPEVVLSTDRKAYQYGEDFISFFPHDSIDINENEIIFAGYGVDDFRYNDYAFQDVKDKVVLIAGTEPRDVYGNYIVSGGQEPSKWSKDPIHAYILKRNAAMKHGAKALLIYDPINHDYFWHNFKKHFARKKLDISVEKDSVFDFFVNKDIFEDITGYDKPEDIEYTKKTRKMTVPITMSYKNTDEVIESENVMGIIPGEDKNGRDSDQYILVISHYDAMGKEEGKIYNGANDNATGVAASFEMIEAFRTAIDTGFIPKRNIVFVNFSGKEQDMLGSRFYAAHPVIPLEKTVAVIELHKLGRLRDTEELGEFYPINISFDGFEKKIFKQNIKKIQAYNDHITLRFKPLVEQSDYTQFMKKKVPVIYFYGSSNYKDYHKPTDTSDLVSYDILEKRTRFIFQIIWELAYQKNL